MKKIVLLFWLILLCQSAQSYEPIIDYCLIYEINNVYKLEYPTFKPKIRLQQAIFWDFPSPPLFLPKILDWKYSFTVNACQETPHYIEFYDTNDRVYRRIYFLWAYTTWSTYNREMENKKLYKNNERRKLNK